MKKYDINLWAKDGTKLDREETVTEERLLAAVQSRANVCAPGETIVIKQVK